MLGASAINMTGAKSRRVSKGMLLLTLKLMVCEMLVTSTV